jgi:chromosome segregation ATPase
MISPRWISSASASLLLALSIANLAQAQTARSGCAASAQLVQQLQQLASERTAMQAEAARMKKELEDMRKERDALKNVQKSADLRARSSSAALAQATAQREAAEQELKQTKDKTEQLIAKFRETIQQLREIETDRATTKQILATRDQELRVCLDRNSALYKLNDEVLTRFDKQSVFSRIGASEPFTRIKRVQLENLVDDYKARANDERVTPQNIGGAARAAAPPASKPAEVPPAPIPTPNAAAEAPSSSTTPTAPAPPPTRDQFSEHH